MNTNPRCATSDQDNGPGKRPLVNQDIQHTMVGARVSEEVSRGVFANSAIVLEIQGLFAVDFLLTAVHPRQLVARVFLARAQFAELVAALRTSLAMFDKAFGRPVAACPCAAQTSNFVSQGSSVGPAGPTGAGEQTLEEVYGQLRVSDKTLEGSMANYAMIRHTAHEFCLDFVTNVYPRSTLTSRVFVAAGRVPALLETLAGAWERFQKETADAGPAAS